MNVFFREERNLSKKKHRILQQDYKLNNTLLLQTIGQRFNTIGWNIILIFLIIHFSGCGCPESQKIGDVDILNESLEFIPYTGDEQLIFFNEKNQQVVLRSRKGFEVEDVMLEIWTECERNILDREIIYYDAKNHNIKFEGTVQQELMAVEFKVSTHRVLRNPADIVFYDNLEIRYGADILRFRTSDRGNILSLQEIMETYENFSYAADTTILGKKFENVFYSVNELLQTGLFYNKEKGLLAFYFREELYVLDKVL